MNRTSFVFSAFALGVLAIFATPACKDDATVNEEPPLPGPGPIGMGGFSAAGGTSAGGAGAGGTSAGGTGTGGTGAAGMGTGGTDTGGTGGTDAGGAGGSLGGASGTGGASGSGGSPPMPVCQTTGSAQFRVGNLVPAAGNLDFCIKGPTDMVFTGPVMSCLGVAGGLGFKGIGKMTGVAPGTYDVRVVSGGDCTAAAYATKAGVVFDAASSFDLMVMGGGTTGEAATIGAFKNDAPPTDASVNLRFVNAIHKAGGGLDVGLTDGGMLPTNVNTAVLANAPFGGVAPAPGPGVFPIDAQGYATMVAVLDMTNVGASLTGTMPAIFAATIDIGPANASITAFGVGIVGDGKFPPAALLCNDLVDTGMMSTCKSL